MTRHPARTKVHLAAIALLVFAANVVVARSLDDGPYVREQPNGTWLAQWLEGDGPTARVKEQQVRPGESVAIAGVGGLPSFTATLRASSIAPPNEVPLQRGTPLFVVADMHGEFEIAVTLLRNHKIIDGQLHWSFGKGHLVLLGDVFDRGAHQTEILWLIYQLEAEAQRAGGAVHMLLGNHESMMLSGDERYLNPKYRQSAKLLGVRSYAALWDETSLLGRWLRSKAVVMKIGGYLCMHGGLSPQAVEHQLTLEAMNGAVREALLSKQPLPPTRHALASFVLGPAGPLWYRGYFGDMRAQGGPAQATAEEVRRIREHYGAKRLLVGHTKVPTVTALYGGDVIAVQVYPHRDPETGAAVMEAIRIEGDRIFKASVDGSLEPLQLGSKAAVVAE
jgi:hypothetical protein